MSVNVSVGESGLSIDIDGLLEVIEETHHGESDETRTRMAEEVISRAGDICLYSLAAFFVEAADVQPEDVEPAPAC